MMIRSALLSVILTCAFAAPTLAQDDAKTAECRRPEQIAINIMAERENGSNQRRAERRVIRALPEESKKYETAIPALADWIFSLPEDRMTSEVSDLVFQSCISQ
jgi:hypothetical protein